jgi:hypothetical protein
MKLVRGQHDLADEPAKLPLKEKSKDTTTYMLAKSYSNVPKPFKEGRPLRWKGKKLHTSSDWEKLDEEEERRAMFLFCKQTGTHKTTKHLVWKNFRQKGTCRKVIGTHDTVFDVGPRFTLKPLRRYPFPFVVAMEESR